MKPKYIHDCDSCKFLGLYKINISENEIEEYDLYFCESKLFSGSLIARYGSDGSNYSSMGLDIIKGALDIFKNQWANDPLIEAYYRVTR